MKNFSLLALLCLFVPACQGSAPPAEDASFVDADVADGAPVDAGLLADGDAVDGFVADADVDGGDAEVLDAALDAASDVFEVVDASLDGGTVSLADACGQVEDFWVSTGCNPDGYWCGFTAADVPAASVEACLSSAAEAFRDVGPGDFGARCGRALAALNLCHE